MKLIKILKHTKLVLKHKWVVFKLCCKVGIPWRGFMHDWSKFSPTEFIESINYYVGNRSPILLCKEDKGYSEAWLHHKGRNKHHHEYWIDLTLPEKTSIMPYKYAAEMICDKMAAGIVYQGNKWTKDWQINYYMREREKCLIHPQIDKFMIATFTGVSENGLDKTLTKQNIKQFKHNNYIRKNGVG